MSGIWDFRAGDRPGDLPGGPMDWHGIGDELDCIGSGCVARVSIKKRNSLYTRVRWVKGLDVFWEIRAGLFLGGVD